MPPSSCASDIIHTVGPEVYGDVTQENKDVLVSCYRNSLELAVNSGLSTIVSLKTDNSSLCLIFAK